MDNHRIPDQLAPEVLELAARYYAEQSASFSESELIDAAAEANIPPEYIRQAIQEVEAKHQQIIERRKIRQLQYQKAVKVLVPGTAAAIKLGLSWLILVTVIRSLSPTNPAVSPMQEQSPQEQLPVEGTVRDLQMLRAAYEKSSDRDHRAAIRQTILQRAANVDLDKLPADIRLFVESLHLETSGSRETVCL